MTGGNMLVGHEKEGDEKVGDGDDDDNNDEYDLNQDEIDDVTSIGPSQASFIFPSLRSRSHNLDSGSIQFRSHNSFLTSM